MKKLKHTLTKRIPALLGMCLLLTVSQCWAQSNSFSLLAETPDRLSPISTDGSLQSYTFFQTGNAAAIVPGTTDIGNNCDDCTTTITLPFDYEIYGTTYTTAIVSSNGNIQFTGDSTESSHTALSNGSFGATIFVYWTNLTTQDSVGGQGIFTSVSGSAPNRVFNIEWRAKICCSNGTPDNNFEVRLYEGQQKFDIIYGTITTDGSNSTAGVQKDGTDFTQYQYNTAGTLSSGMSMTTSLEPTDAEVVLSGRVATTFDEPIVGARVTLTDSFGERRTVLTGKFGNFRFRNVPSGAFYVVSASARGYRFSPQTLPVTEDMTDIIFTPQP